MEQRNTLHFTPFLKMVTFYKIIVCENWEIDIGTVYVCKCITIFYCTCPPVVKVRVEPFGICWKEGTSVSLASLFLVF